ncbi:MAG TPA: cysteine desulfurase [candidate division Zixibacteria bacterium]|nr:cysteine desulfurase [candidate division Zixibacteria bacterium]
MRKVYLDHAATTATRPEVLTAMEPYIVEQFGNPSSLHQFGRWTNAAVEEARDRVAELMGAKPEEIYFTSGGTESDNMVIKGIGWKNFEKRGHFITTKVEHKAVLETVAFMEKLGFTATYLDVDENSLVSPDDLRKAIRDDTLLVSIMMVNNEVGTIEPIAELAEVAHERGVAFHTDAVQAFGKIPVDVRELGVDFLAMSGHKFYGPKGVGVCYVKRESKKLLMPHTHGGSHESGLRAGTLNVPGIVGFAKAFELAIGELDAEHARQKKLADMLFNGFNDALDGVQLNGHPTDRIPSLLNLSFDKVEGESILLSLDMQGIAVSSGSACSSKSLEPSHVLIAMGCDHLRAHSCIRFSLGRENTEEDIEYVLRVVPPIIERLRSVSAL